MNEQALLLCGTVAPQHRISLVKQGLFRPAQAEQGAVLIDETLGLLFVVNRAGELELRTLTRGELLFSYPLGEAGSGPIHWLDEQLIIATSEGRMIALDGRKLRAKALAGEKLSAALLSEAWRYETQGVVRQPLVWDEERIYLSDGSNTLYALKRGSGRWLWQHRRARRRHAIGRRGGGTRVARG